MIMVLSISCLQVILPLGKEPSRRSGMNPVADSEQQPEVGKAIESITGETVVVRKRPDMDTVKKDLQASGRVPSLISTPSISTNFFSDCDLCAGPVEFRVQEHRRCIQACCHLP